MQSVVKSFKAVRYVTKRKAAQLTAKFSPAGKSTASQHKASRKRCACFNNSERFSQANSFEKQSQILETTRRYAKSCEAMQLIQVVDCIVKQCEAAPNHAKSWLLLGSEWPTHFVARAGKLVNTPILAKGACVTQPPSLYSGLHQLHASWPAG
eukprot:3086067-Pleurochrysis_carterae.AAC.2